MDHLRVTPVRVRLHDADLRVDRLRLIGFRAVGSSGWEGPVRPLRQDAVEDVREKRMADAAELARVL